MPEGAAGALPTRPEAPRVGEHSFDGSHTEPLPMCLVRSQFEVVVHSVPHGAQPRYIPGAMSTNRA